MRRLRTKMILLIGLPTLIIYVAVLGVAVLQIRAQARDNVNREMMRQADQLAARFNSAFESAAAIATTTGRFMENAPPQDLEQVYAQLESNTLSNPVIYGAAMAFEPTTTDPAVNLVSPYVYRSPGGGDGTGGLTRMNIGREVYDWHADETWQWWHLPKRTGRGAWCDPYFDEGAGNVLMVTYGEPFTRDGQFAGVNTVDIMLPTLRESIGDAILGDLDFVIVTRSGMYVFSPNAADIMKRTVFDEARSLNNSELEALAQRLVLGTSGMGSVEGWNSPEQTLVYFSPIRSTGWSFAVRVSEREAFAPANAMARNAAIALALALALIIGCILAVSGRITRPLAMLKEQVHEIARGNLDARVHDIAGRDEISELAQTFNRMTGDLRDNLDRLAKERASRQKMERDLDLAREIQTGLLPKTTPDIPGFEIAGWNLAADQTGGDYFDWQELEDGRTIITLADVAGHGIGPALMVSVCRAYMRASAMNSGVRLSDAVKRLNDLLRDDMPEGRFITAAFGVIDPARSEVALVSAGQAPLLFYEAATGVVHQWNADSLPLGVVRTLEMDEPRVIGFRPGDMLVIVTDGFFEWNNTDGERFGTAGLRDFLAQNHHLAPKMFIKSLHEKFVRSTVGLKQEDDLTALVLRGV